MKKINFFILFLFVLSIFSFSKATSSDGQKGLQGVGLRFCNNGIENNNLAISMETEFAQPGEEKELCLYFFNTSENEVKLKYGFIEGVIGKEGEKHCRGDINLENNFSKIVSQTNPREIIIENGEYEIIKEKVKFPLGMSGVTNGCVWYTVEDKNPQLAGGMFAMIGMKASPIQYLIGGESNIKSELELLSNKGKIYSSNNKINVEFKDNKLFLKLKIDNKGNVNQNLQINGKIFNNTFGFEKNFEIQNLKVGSKTIQEIEKEIGIIPSYKGFFDIELTLNAEPIFDFEIPNLDPKYKETIKINETGKIFIFSWIRVIALILAILILFLILRPLFKRHKVSN